MGTRSNIGLQNEDGSYDIIYCHWDGYPSYNGRLLFEHYQDVKKIKKLIALGDLSSLSEEIGTKHPFDAPTRDEGGHAEHKAKYGKMCTAYKRDRGEKDTEAKHYADYDALQKMLADAWTEWLYIYRVQDGKWYYTNNPSPTWFKTCSEEQMQTSLLTPAAWSKDAA